MKERKKNICLHQASARASGLFTYLFVIIFFAGHFFKLIRFSKKTTVLNEALDFVKTRCEGIEERFSNNRVIVRPLSWLVCIGPFQPPNKGGLPLLRSRKSFLQFQFFLQTRRGLQLQRSGNPFSTFSFFNKQGRDPSTEIRKSFLRTSQANS